MLSELLTKPKILLTDSSTIRRPTSSALSTKIFVLDGSTSWLIFSQFLPFQLLASLVSSQWLLILVKAVTILLAWLWSGLSKSTASWVLPWECLLILKAAWFRSSDCMSTLITTLLRRAFSKKYLMINTGLLKEIMPLIMSASDIDPNFP